MPKQKQDIVTYSSVLCFFRQLKPGVHPPELTRSKTLPTIIQEKTQGPDMSKIPSIGTGAQARASSAGPPSSPKDKNGVFSLTPLTAAGG